MNLREWEKVKMFRTVVDPSIVAGKVQQAHMLPDLPGHEAWFHSPTGSVYVKDKIGRRHIVPTGNLSKVELYPDEEDHGKIQDTRGARSKKTETA